ncbi:MAG: hypothetical protein ABF326_11315, partial [Arenicellales bacterium]
VNVQVHQARSERLGIIARIAHYGPASTHANLTRPSIRAQSILKPKSSLFANEEESIYEGMPHVFVPTLPETVESQAAIAKVRNWVTEHLLDD